MERNLGTVERLVSIAAGGSLVAGGILRGGVLGVLTAGVGAGLAFRGATGWCAVYNQLGINMLENPKPIELTATTLIEGSREEVYEALRNAESGPTWNARVFDVETIDDGRQRWAAHRLAGRDVEWTREYITEKKGRELVWRDRSSSPGERETRVTLQDEGDRGTRVNLTFYYTPPKSRLAIASAKAAAPVVGQRLTANLRRLRQLIETGEVPTTENQPTGERSAKRKVVAAVAP